MVGGERFELPTLSALRAGPVPDQMAYQTRRKNGSPDENEVCG